MLVPPQPMAQGLDAGKFTDTCVRLPGLFTAQESPHAATSLSVRAEGPGLFPAPSTPTATTVGAGRLMAVNAAAMSLA
jgi:hypothetical protein